MSLEGSWLVTLCLLEPPREKIVTSLIKKMVSKQCFNEKNK